MLPSLWLMNKQTTCLQQKSRLRAAFFLNIVVLVVASMLVYGWLKNPGSQHSRIAFFYRHATGLSASPTRRCLFRSETKPSWVASATISTASKKTLGVGFTDFPNSLGPREGCEFFWIFVLPSSHHGHYDHCQTRCCANGASNPERAAFDPAPTGAPFVSTNRWAVVVGAASRLHL